MTTSPSALKRHADHITNPYIQVESKRQRMDSRGKMTTTATPIRIHRSKFQPQLGAKRLIIKNARRTPLPNLQLYYDSIFIQIKDALKGILSGERLQQPLERLYRDVEELCRNQQSELLYKTLRDDCQLHLKSESLVKIRSGLSIGESVESLRIILECWGIWSAKGIKIRSIFSYLDRSYLLNSKKYPQLNDMSLSLFRNVVLDNDDISTVAYQGMCELVQRDRLGHSGFDAALLKDAIQMLNVLDLYKLGFHPRFLLTTNDYMKDFAAKKASEGLRSYILACATLIERERTRCDVFNFESSTKRQLLTSAYDILARDNSEFLLSRPAVAKLLEDGDTSSLKDLYLLLSASNIQSDLKGPWEEYIKQAGGAIIKDPSKADEMVVRLLELKRFLEIVTRDSFGKDEFFKRSMREAFGNFMNNRTNIASFESESKVGEDIAKYIDALLRGGLKAVPRSLASDATDRTEAEQKGHASTGDEDAELDRQLEQGLELFRFIHGKDTFEAFYKKDLARRLLMGRSASQDAERNMLTKLKSECGSNFTHNLEQMFKDQDLSRDEMISYKQSLSNTSKTTMDLQVSVLQQAAWPTYPEVAVNLPDEVARHIEKFHQHYIHKHTGRRLSWKHALAHSVVKAQFDKSTKELVVSGFQAIVLLLFNEIRPDGNLSYVDIQKHCGLIDTELQRTLQSLACTKLRVLNKHPKGREVNKSDTFTVNSAFTDPKFRIKINQIQLKETKAENKATHERVAADRQYETQAAIVRIMKSRKKMTHANLVSEVIDQTKSRGAVEVTEIKKNIEKLIEKDYLERDGNSYEYLA